MIEVAHIQLVSTALAGVSLVFAAVGLFRAANVARRTTQAQIFPGCVERCEPVMEPHPPGVCELRLAPGDRGLPASTPELRRTLRRPPVSPWEVQPSIPTPHLARGGKAEKIGGVSGVVCYLARPFSGGLVAAGSSARPSRDQSHPFVPVSAKKTIVRKPAAAPAKARTVGAATAAAILGRPLTGAGARPAAKHPPEWEKFRSHLLDLREQLTKQMNGLAKESAEEMPGYSMHMADSGTDNFDRDFALSLLSSDQDAIYEIDEALKRIEKGTYGTCELTGHTIPKARLEAIPWARFTVEAQAQLERDGALRQRRLGALGSLETSGPSDLDDDDEVEEKPAKEKE
ncbi:MAG TPA: TraR/DksA C4-type zinc finger protein [Verrucomicrobiota bacterium]|nr:TraR/DksA C4-type zinc finger protein [Verrucomicrobiota bacterium]